MGKQNEKIYYYYNVRGFYVNGYTLKLNEHFLKIWLDFVMIRPFLGSALPLYTAMVVRLSVQIQKKFIYSLNISWGQASGFCSTSVHKKVYLYISTTGPINVCTLQLGEAKCLRTAFYCVAVIFFILKLFLLCNSCLPVYLQGLKYINFP
jgi:hypothetical protein